MSCNEQAAKPHAVCLPCPAQGHINAMLKLAMLLHWKGFHISFVNTELDHGRMVTARGGPSFLDGLPSDFELLTIPDGFPPSVSRDLDDLSESYRNVMKAPFADLIGRLNQRAALDRNFPAVSCIISDCLMTFSTVPAGEKFGIPVVNFWPVSASVTMCFMQSTELLAKGFVPSKDVDGSSSGYLDRTIDWIPGIKHMRLHDFPTFLRNTEADEMIFHLAIDAIKSSDGAVATVIHTFESLEQEVLTNLSSMLLKPVYATGPLPLLLKCIPDEENRTRNVRCNLWEENTECLQWLDSKEPSSVLYINFGSIASLTHQQVTEFAMGIADSGHPFLWIIRPDLVEGNAAVLPPEFAEKTEGRAFTTEWCPQEEVLNHPAIGGFLTHCGWNSAMESLSAGVPMLCWPFFADQHTNCWFICTEYGIGREINHDVRRDEVAGLVKELMEGERGRTMKERALEWMKLAEESTGPCGSSSRDFDRLLRETLSK